MFLNEVWFEQLRRAAERDRASKAGAEVVDRLRNLLDALTKQDETACGEEKCCGKPEDCELEKEVVYGVLDSEDIETGDFLLRVLESDNVSPEARDVASEALVKLLKSI